jgi:hypothetical protein
MSGIKRLHAYSLLMVIIFAGSHLLGVLLRLAVVVMGALISLSGTIWLLRFLYRFPSLSL